MSSAVKPVLQALLIADHAYVDAVTGKKVVAGIFHHMFFSKQVLKRSKEDSTVRLPFNPSGYKAGSPFCYVSLTEVRGAQDFVLRYVDLSSDRSVFEICFRVDSKNPLATQDAVIPLPSLPTGTSGVFALELTWNEETIGACRILVTEQKENADGA
jgi:hypothetical protein